MFKMYIYKSLINPGTHSFNVNGIKIVDDIILNLDKITVSSFLLWKYWYVKEPLCKKKKISYALWHYYSLLNEI